MKKLVMASLISTALIAGTAFANKFKNVEKSAVFLAGGNTPNSIYRENEIYKNSINEVSSNDEFSNDEDWNSTNNEQQKEGISKIFLLSAPAPEQVQLQKKLIDLAKAKNIALLVRCYSPRLGYCAPRLQNKDTLTFAVLAADDC